ncbi:hypothetical protein [Dechloromonas sp. HYN0024]|uniref:hypothetical protein n=1 Tax=Dechloromonas sp. HYN0024 TaxID=2231055 RepID=UPI0013C352B2|nr:hypothetical protein [Dechloromonas sp. HYN0024]
MPDWERLSLRYLALATKAQLNLPERDTRELAEMKLGQGSYKKPGKYRQTTRNFSDGPGHNIDKPLKPLV